LFEAQSAESNLRLALLAVEKLDVGADQLLEATLQPDQVDVRCFGGVPAH
jgi:hypothetical protein